MSIAVSAVVAPSRWLLAMTLAVSTGCIGIGLLIAAGAVDLMAGSAGPAWSSLPSTAVWMRACIALACIGAGLHAARGILHRRAHFRIDISGTGQIRMKRWNANEASNEATVHIRKPALSGGPMTLLPQSTLWPKLMVLRLQCELGHIHTLIVLPDALPETSFRMLSVACHWIAAHNIRAGSENT